MPPKNVPASKSKGIHIEKDIYLNVEHCDAFLDAVSTIIDRAEKAFSRHSKSCRIDSDSEDRSLKPARIDWCAVSFEIWTKRNLVWTPRYCQGLWKFLAYAEKSVILDAFSGENDTELLEHSDEEDIRVNPAEFTRKDMQKNKDNTVSRGKKRRIVEIAEEIDEVSTPFPLLACDVGLQPSNELIPLCSMASLPFASNPSIQKYLKPDRKNCSKKRSYSKVAGVTQGISIDQLISTHGNDVTVSEVEPLLLKLPQKNSFNSINRSTKDSKSSAKICNVSQTNVPVGLSEQRHHDSQHLKSVLPSLWSSEISRRRAKDISASKECARTVLERCKLPPLPQHDSFLNNQEHSKAWSTHFRRNVDVPKTQHESYTLSSQIRPTNLTFTSEVQTYQVRTSNQNPTCETLNSRDQFDCRPAETGDLQLKLVKSQPLPSQNAKNTTCIPSKLASKTVCEGNMKYADVNSNLSLSQFNKLMGVDPVTSETVQTETEYKYPNSSMTKLTNICDIGENSSNLEPMQLRLPSLKRARNDV